MYDICKVEDWRLVGSWIPFSYIAFTLHKTQRCAYIFIKSCNVSRLFKQKTQYHLSLLYRPKATNKVNQTMIFSLTNSHLLLTNEDFLNLWKIGEIWLLQHYWNSLAMIRKWIRKWFIVMFMQFTKYEKKCSSNSRYYLTIFQYQI